MFRRHFAFQWANRLAAGGQNRHKGNTVLIIRTDFNLFCRFDEPSIPDYSTLCRYRLAQGDTLSELPGLINRQLTEKSLKSAAALQPQIPLCAGNLLKTKPQNQ